MGSPCNPEMSKPIALALKVLVTAILFYWVIAQIQFDGIQEIFKSLDFMFFVFAILSHGVAFLILSLRWWILYRVKSRDHRYSELAVHRQRHKPARARNTRSDRHIAAQHPIDAAQMIRVVLAENIFHRHIHAQMFTEGITGAQMQQRIAGR